MKTDIHFSSQLSQLFLELETFQTKVVEKTKRHILFQQFFFRKSCRLRVLKNTVQPDRSQMTIWRTRIAGYIPKATNTHSAYTYVIFLLFHCNKGCTNAP
jgi:hypothetical protein